jgi:chemotaxis protein MotA
MDLARGAKRPVVIADTQDNPGGGGHGDTTGLLAELLAQRTEGAVLGLIHVMANLSDPSKLGAGIAEAFVATVYGVGSANLLFLPMGARLKKIVQTDTEDRAMILAGLQGIVAGANTRQIAEMLSPFMPHDGSHKDGGGDDAKAAA